VVSAKPAAAEATFEELNQEFLRALGKIGGSDKRRKV
jgi:RNase P protein component